jgi:hypothetical protein
MSGCAQVRGFCEVYLSFGVAQVGPDNVRWRFLFVDDLGVTYSCLTRLFSLHLSRPPNSTLLLYSRNIKTTSST